MPKQPMINVTAPMIIGKDLSIIGYTIMIVVCPLLVIHIRRTNPPDDIVVQGVTVTARPMTS